MLLSDFWLEIIYIFMVMKKENLIFISNSPKCNLEIVAISWCMDESLYILSCPVILLFDRDKIATEIIFAANLSEKPSKQHLQNRPKSDMGKYDNLNNKQCLPLPIC